MTKAPSARSLFLREPKALKSTPPSQSCWKMEKALMISVQRQPLLPRLRQLPQRATRLPHQRHPRRPPLPQRHRPKRMVVVFLPPPLLVGLPRKRV